MNLRHLILALLRSAQRGVLLNDDLLYGVLLRRHPRGIGAHLYIQIVCISSQGVLSVQQPLSVELRSLCDPGNLLLQLGDLILYDLPISKNVLAVCRLP